MSFHTIQKSLCSLDTTPGSQSSTSLSARTVYHQTAQDAMILYGVHIAVQEARDSIEMVENMDFDEGLRRLRMHIESISRMAHRLGERLAESTHTSDCSHTPVNDNSTPNQVPTPDVPVVTPPVTGLLTDQNAIQASTAPPVFSPPPPLSPAVDLSEEYEAIIERRIKRQSSVEGASVSVGCTRPPKRANRGRYYVGPYSRPAHQPEQSRSPSPIVEFISDRWNFLS